MVLKHGGLGYVNHFFGGDGFANSKDRSHIYDQHFSQNCGVALRNAIPAVKHELEPDHFKKTGPTDTMK